MGLRNLYVRKDDEAFWDRAEQLAAGRGVALSVWVSRLIQSHIYDLGSKQVAEPTPVELLTEIQSRTAELQALLSRQGEES
jgi:hypothetical protein